MATLARAARSLVSQATKPVRTVTRRMMSGDHHHDHRVFEPGPFTTATGLVIVAGGVSAGIGLVAASWQFQQRKQVGGSAASVG